MKTIIQTTIDGELRIIFQHESTEISCPQIGSTITLEHLPNEGVYRVDAVDHEFYKYTGANGFIDPRVNITVSPVIEPSTESELKVPFKESVLSIEPTAYDIEANLAQIHNALNFQQLPIETLSKFIYTIKDIEKLVVDKFNSKGVTPVDELN